MHEVVKMSLHCNLKLPEALHWNMYLVFVQDFESCWFYVLGFFLLIFPLHCSVKHVISIKLL